MRKQAHIFIHGKVTGVWFRAFLKNEADELNIKGWVRNASFTTVEAVFEGEEEKINKLIKLCRQGPPAAVVDKVEVKWEEETTGYKSFEIRY